jgi:hypothetical protein
MGARKTGVSSEHGEHREAARRPVPGPPTDHRPRSPPQREPPRQTGAVKAPPESMKSSLTQRVNARAAERWPDLAGVEVRFRSNFAYISGRLRDGTTTQLCRLSYGGVLHTWGFAIYRASHDDYQNAILPTGYSAGSPEEALDCACGLYLNDPTAWLL